MLIMRNLYGLLFVFYVVGFLQSSELLGADLVLSRFDLSLSLMVQE